MTQFHQNPKTVPSAQELSGLPAATIAAELVLVEAVLAARYDPNNSGFAVLCDKLGVEGRMEERVAWADITRYRANLYMAQRIQALEGPTGGIGLLDVRTNGEAPGGQAGWGSYGW